MGIVPVIVGLLLGAAGAAALGRRGVTRARRNGAPANRRMRDELKAISLDVLHRPATRSRSG